MNKFKGIIVCLYIFSTSYSFGNISKFLKPSEDPSFHYKKGTTYALRINPQGFLYGVYGASADLKFHKHWFASPTYQYFGKNVSPRNLELDQVGASITYCFYNECFENTWYSRVTLGVIHVYLIRTVNTVIFEGDTYSPFIRTTFGRNWKIFNGLHAGAGIGLTQALLDKAMILHDLEGRTIYEDSPVSRKFKPVLEMYLGWAF